MSEKTCETCEYFVQHYRKSAKDEKKYDYVDCGHCTGKIVKKRRAEDHACEIYIEHETL